MSYHVVHSDALEFEERPTPDGAAPRQAADVTEPGGLEQSRARVWRYPAHSRGRRHKDLGQEEVFVVLEGTLTMLLGEPPERVELEPRSVVAVEPKTPLQLRNDGDEEVAVFVYGAPPVQAGAEFFDDPEP
jgi:mannose-6-phosphate isomerase-like protein (cupin superfamily)